MLKSLFSYLEINYAKGFEDEDTEAEFKNKALMCKNEKWLELAKFVDEVKIDQLIPIEIELRSYRKF